MLGDVGLLELGVGHELTDAALAVGQLAQEKEAGRVGQGFEEIGLTLDEWIPLTILHGT